MNRLLILSCSAAIVLAGCATEKPEKEEKKPPAGPTLVGRIASVPPDKRFVLIQSFGKLTVEPGMILTTRGDEGRTANLKVTGERMGQFAAADVQSGDVLLGDAVYSLHTPKPPANPVSPTPTGPGIPPPAATGNPVEGGNPSAPLPELPEQETVPGN